MRRSTYLIAALTILLVAGILVLITLSLEKSPPTVVGAPEANALPPAAAAALGRPGPGGTGFGRRWRADGGGHAARAAGARGRTIRP